MIICFEGTPGSGKSYDAVKKILDNLKAGRMVYTNIEGIDEQEQREFIKTYTGLDDYELHSRLVHIDNVKAVEFWKHCKSGSLIMIDEVQNLFNARDWSKDQNRDVTKWASTHRHHGYDVVFMTQDVKRMDSALRSLLEWTYLYKKANFFGSLIQKKYLVYPYSGDGSGKPLSKPQVKTYDARIFNCYKSYVSKDIKELKVMEHTNILKHPIFYAMPVVLGIFIYFFFKSGFSHGEILPGSLTAKARLSSKPTVTAQVVDPAAQIREDPQPVVMLGEGVYSAPSATVANNFLCVGRLEYDGEIRYIFAVSGDGGEYRKNYNLKMDKGHDLGVQVGESVRLAQSVKARLY